MTNIREIISNTNWLRVPPDSNEKNSDTLALEKVRRALDYSERYDQQTGFGLKCKTLACCEARSRATAQIFYADCALYQAERLQEEIDRINSNPNLTEQEKQRLRDLQRLRFNQNVYGSPFPYEIPPSDPNCIECGISGNAPNTLPYFAPQPNSPSRNWYPAPGDNDGGCFCCETADKAYKDFVERCKRSLPAQTQTQS